MMPMNKDGVSDERLAHLVENPRHASETYELGRIFRELQERRAADRRAPAVVTEEMVERAVKAWADHPPTRVEPDIGAVHDSAVVMRAALEAALSVRAEPVAKNYAQTVAPYATALRMVRDAIEELFGPTASLESEEAVLLRGPEPHHDAEALIAALQRIRSALVATPAPSISAGYRLVPEEPMLGLKRIVEEIDGAFRHGTWRDEHGNRLKDTHEWVAFYNALSSAAAPAQQQEGDGE